MGLTDFWDNITTPGFIPAAIEEFGQMWGEIRKEAKELWEEGEELFTDGFVEMVIKDNNDYLTSAQKQEKARSLIAQARKEILTARGVTGCGEALLAGVADTVRRTADALDCLDDRTLELAADWLRKRFSAIEILFPLQLRVFARQVEKILDVPAAPGGSASPPTGAERKSRVAAADVFLSEAEEFLRQMCDDAEDQFSIGPLFNLNSLVGNIGEALNDCCCHSQDTWSDLFCLPQSTEEDHAIYVARSALLFASASCSLLGLGLSGPDEVRPEPSALLAQVLEAFGEEGLLW